MNDTSEQPDNTATSARAKRTEWPIFISYRRSDSTRKLALELKKRLEAATIEATPGQVFALDVFVDVAEAHQPNFQANLVPHLHHSRALIVLADDGAATRKNDGSVDYLYSELDWWAAKRKATPPIILQLDAKAGSRLVADRKFSAWREVSFMDCFWEKWEKNGEAGEAEKRQLIGWLRQSISNYGLIIHLEEVRRLKRRALIATVFAIIAAIAGIVAWILAGYYAEEKSKAEASLRQSRAKTASVESLRLVREDPAKAIAFAIHAIETDPSIEVRPFVVEALANLPVRSEHRFHQARTNEVSIFEEKARVNQIAFIDESRLLIIPASGPVELFDTTMARISARFEVAPGIERPIAIASAAHRFAFIDTAGHVQEWQISLPYDEKSDAVKAHEIVGSFHSLTMTHDGSSLATIDSGGEIQILSFGTKENISRVGRGNMVVLSGDGKKAGIRRENSSFDIVDSKSGAVLRTISPSEEFKFGVREEIALLLSTLKDGNERSRDILKGVIDPLEFTGRLTSVLVDIVEKDPILKERFEKLGKETKLADSDEKTGTLPLEGLTGAQGVLAEVLGHLDAVKGVSEPLEAAFFDNDQVFGVWVQTPGFLNAGFWNLNDSKSERKAIKSFFSRLVVIPETGQFGIVTPTRAGLLGFSKDDTGSMIPALESVWPLTSQFERLGACRAAVFSANGNFLLSSHAPYLQMRGAGNASVNLWLSHALPDVGGGNPNWRQQLNPHLQPTISASFSPSGMAVATYATDGMVRVWSIAAESDLLGGQKGTDELAWQIMNGVRFMPKTSMGVLERKFKGTDELLESLRTVTQRRLTRDELMEYSLEPGVPPPSQTKSWEKPLLEFLNRPHQIAVQQ